MKIIRNFFTKEDDNILLSYINNTELATSGINLYKIIEAAVITINFLYILQ